METIERAKCRKKVRKSNEDNSRLYGRNKEKEKETQKNGDKNMI